MTVHWFFRVFPGLGIRWVTVMFVLVRNGMVCIWMPASTWVLLVRVGLDRLVGSWVEFGIGGEILVEGGGLLHLILVFLVSLEVPEKLDLILFKFHALFDATGNFFFEVVIERVVLRDRIGVQRWLVVEDIFAVEVPLLKHHSFVDGSLDSPVENIIHGRRSGFLSCLWALDGGAVGFESELAASRLLVGGFPEVDARTYREVAGGLGEEVSRVRRGEVGVDLVVQVFDFDRVLTIWLYGPIWGLVFQLGIQVSQFLLQLMIDWVVGRIMRWGADALLRLIQNCIMVILLGAFLKVIAIFLIFLI